jgi:hypothetical protein
MAPVRAEPTVAEIEKENRVTARRLAASGLAAIST